MNYGGEAADQIVRYSLDGLEHGIRLSGTLAKNLAVFFAAVLKDQKKIHGRTRVMRMLKENRPLKFFTVPSDRIGEFCREGKKRGLLCAVIRDRKDPSVCEVMVFADDAAKVNRVIDKMNLDFLESECGEAVPEKAEGQETPEAGNQEPPKKEAVQMPEGEVQFEISGLEDSFNIGENREEAGNFTRAQEAEGKNPSGHSLRSNVISDSQEKGDEKPSVAKELNQIKEELSQKEERNKQQKSRGRNRNQPSGRRSKKKSRGKGR